VSAVFYVSPGVSALSSAAMTFVWAAVLLGAGAVLLWQNRHNLSIRRAARVVNAAAVASVLASGFFALAMVCCFECWEGYEWLCFMLP
jgi:uncharacterized membrane protein YdcZ (DUF606 family)